MFNVVGMSEFAGMANGGLHCWLCQKAVSSRALFCHHCGTIQPVRDIDHFARLGMERRIDIDMELLEHQYAALSRTLDPQRFMIRGIGERGHAAKQLEALNEAYEVLREPLRRGRYWLALNEKTAQEASDSNPFVKELRGELDKASAPSHCDRVAQKAGQAMEQGIMGLMQALRGQKWKEANDTLTEIDGLEAILGDVRMRRLKLTPDQDNKGGLSSVD
ncbi:MAG: molecular chaperone DnaJ [Alphaproteobacteria bacterium]